MLLRHQYHIYRALRSLRGAYRPVELAPSNLGPITAADHHMRLLHSAVARFYTTHPVDPLSLEAEIIDESEQAARNEVDVQIDDIDTPTITDAAAALGLSSLGSLPRPTSPDSSVSRSVSTEGGNINFEVGRLARLADGACSVRCGDTTVLATVTSDPVTFGRRDLRAIPFVVDYREKLYAVGRIPGTYNKREGMPKEHEMLAARRLERALRPLLPRGYSSPMDISASVLSADGSADPEVLAINAASAALAASDIPWGGPVGAARVALIGGKIVLNPRPDVEQKWELSILVASTEDRVVMLEASGECVAEEEFLEALRVGVLAAQELIPAQKELAAARGRVKRVPELAGADPAAARRVAELAREAAHVILCDSELGCAARMQALGAAKVKIVEKMRASGSWRADFARIPGSGCVTSSDIDHAFSAALSQEMRCLAIEEGLRGDGRGPIDLRSQQFEADHVPIVHGSAVVDAGDTQALCTATVGSTAEQQRIESLLGGEDTKRLFVHVSVPDFATAAGVERRGIFRGPIVRHEMDRSSFVERALLPTLPSEEEFPFAVRLNAEILAADGGSGPAAVCGGTVAMSDAGVPLRSLVAAVSIGMVSEGGAWNGEPSPWPTDMSTDLGRYELLTDPSGLEISMGDMELRVAGTAQGITACQLDVQIPGGLPLEVVEEALGRAKVARLRTLATMQAAIVPHGEVRAAHAPVFGGMKIPASAVGAVIGREGSVLRGIEAQTGAKVHIGDNGDLVVFAPSVGQFNAARAAVRSAAGETLEKGKMYTAKVIAVKDFGAFVMVPGCDMRAMLHVSEIAPERIRAVEDFFKTGDLLDVVFLGRDDRGTLRVSRKAALALKGETGGGSTGPYGGSSGAVGGGGDGSASSGNRGFRNQRTGNRREAYTPPSSDAPPTS